MKCKTIYLLLIYIQPFVMWAVAANNDTKRQGRDCECGKSIEFSPGSAHPSQRIINGKKVTPIYKYPWMVQIKKNGQHLCTGAIIGRNKVLTAAHCLVDEKVSDGVENREESCEQQAHEQQELCKFKVDSLEALHPRKQGMSNAYQVASTAYHPQFNFKSKENDIGVVTVQGNFPCDAYTRPICLPRKKLSKIGRDLVISGWGQSQPGSSGSETPSGELLEGMVKVTPIRGSSGAKKGCDPSIHTNSHFCVSSGKKQLPCMGDSGGSAFLMDPKSYKFYSVGVTSIGRSPTCEVGSDEFYSDTFLAIGFINAQLQSSDAGNGDEDGWDRLGKFFQGSVNGGGESQDRGTNQGMKTVKIGGTLGAEVDGQKILKAKFVGKFGIGPISDCNNCSL